VITSTLGSSVLVLLRVVLSRATIVGGWFWLATWLYPTGPICRSWSPVLMWSAVMVIVFGIVFFFDGLMFLLNIISQKTKQY